MTHHVKKEEEDKSSSSWSTSLMAMSSHWDCLLPPPRRLQMNWNVVAEYLTLGTTLGGLTGCQTFCETIENASPGTCLSILTTKPIGESVLATNETMNMAHADAAALLLQVNPYVACYGACELFASEMSQAHDNQKEQDAQKHESSKSDRDKKKQRNMSSSHLITDTTTSSSCNSTTTSSSSTPSFLDFQRACPPPPAIRHGHRFRIECRKKYTKTKKNKNKNKWYCAGLHVQDPKVQNKRLQKLYQQQEQQQQKQEALLPSHNDHYYGGNNNKHQEHATIDAAHQAFRHAMKQAFQDGIIVGSALTGGGDTRLAFSCMPPQPPTHHPFIREFVYQTHGAQSTDVDIAQWLTSRLGLTHVRFASSATTTTRRHCGHSLGLDLLRRRKKEKDAQRHHVAMLHHQIPLRRRHTTTKKKPWYRHVHHYEELPVHYVQGRFGTEFMGFLCFEKTSLLLRHVAAFDVAAQTGKSDANNDDDDDGGGGCDSASRCGCGGKVEEEEDDVKRLSHQWSRRFHAMFGPKEEAGKKNTTTFTKTGATQEEEETKNVNHVVTRTVQTETKDHCKSVRNPLEALDATIHRLAEMQQRYHDFLLQQEQQLVGASNHIDNHNNNDGSTYQYQYHHFDAAYALQLQLYTRAFLCDIYGGLQDGSWFAMPYLYFLRNNFAPFLDASLLRVLMCGGVSPTASVAVVGVDMTSGCTVTKDDDKMNGNYDNNNNNNKNNKNKNHNRLPYAWYGQFYQRCVPEPLRRVPCNNKLLSMHADMPHAVKQTETPKRWFVPKDMLLLLSKRKQQEDEPMRLFLQELEEMFHPVFWECAMALAMKQEQEQHKKLTVEDVVKEDGQQPLVSAFIERCGGGGVEDVVVLMHRWMNLLLWCESRLLPYFLNCE